jgi:hypothetical protein
MPRRRVLASSVVALDVALACFSLACGEGLSVPLMPGSGGRSGNGSGGLGGAVESSGGAHNGGATTGGRNSSTGGAASGGRPGANGGGPSETGGGPGETGGAPAEGCQPTELQENTTIASSSTDQVRWFDAECKLRSAALTRVGGGYMRQASYEAKGKPRIMTGTGAAGHPGFGYIVNHYGDTATVGFDAPGTFSPVFLGKHHIIYRYQSSPNIAGQDVPVTQEWFFATGRSHPVLATTYDMTALRAGSLVADIRTPYGDIAWNGDENASSTVVSGVAWGDRYKFTTTSEPLTMNSSWDYTEPNQVPYVLEWETQNDAEMGTVQTQTQLQHDAGGYWFYSNWGKKSDNQTRIDGQAGVMTATWNWTYQLNQYELCLDDSSCLDGTTGSHRLAWGANYGALGGTDESGNYSVYGDDKSISGYPYQSYAVFVVFGPHSTGSTYEQVLEVERVQETALRADVGTVVTKLPGGVGRTDEVPLDPPGYDPRYATWNVQVDGDERSQVSIQGMGLSSPVFVFHGRTSLPTKVVLNDGELAPDVGYFASLDGEGKRLWLTVNQALSAPATLILD